eukprot:TRINITY_DN26421_c0_g1_i1.p1 TRINITY_DN26421_c0_g1~~TRINITY_DN26421_c0_g1_i1.p1  ORF type:complete len:108 (+),score=37.30 TRINITY_DN26421_c0_g1_i1:71-394(+)
MVECFIFFFFQAEDGIRDAQESRGLGDVYKRQEYGGDQFVSMSAYPMMPMPEALAKVLEHAQPLATEQLPINDPDVLGRRVAVGVTAIEPFPPFAAAVMDGLSLIHI